MLLCSTRVQVKVWRRILLRALNRYLSVSQTCQPLSIWIVIGFSSDGPRDEPTSRAHLEGRQRLGSVGLVAAPAGVVREDGWKKKY